MSDMKLKPFGDRVVVEPIILEENTPSGIVFAASYDRGLSTGKVLSGLVKRIADGAVGVSVAGPNEIAAAKDALAASA